MTKKGYQIIEPRITEDWLCESKHTYFMVAVLSWLVEKLCDSQDNKLSNVEICIIPVKYVDEYIAIGVHYKNPDDDDLQSYIESKIEEYLSNTSAFEMLDYCFSNERSWPEVRKDYELEAWCESHQ